MPNSEKSTRVRRTPAEIASEALEAATARVEAAKKRQATAEAEVEKAKADVKRLTKLADYAAQNPDLPENADGGEVIDGETERSLSIA